MTEQANFPLESLGDLTIDDLSSYRKTQDKVTIKLLAQDGGIFTHSFNMFDTVETIKTRIGTTFNILHTNIGIYLEGAELRNKDVVGNFKTDEFGILSLKVISKDDNQPLNVFGAFQNFVVPDILTVNVDDSDGGVKEIVVEIENRSIERQRLGGYLDRKSSKYDQKVPTQL